MELKTITKIIMKYCIDLSTAENIAQDILCYVYPEYEDNVGGIMTSKEALETLGENIEYKDYSNATIHLVNKCFAKIELDLERLEDIKKWVIEKIEYLEKGIFLTNDERVKGTIEILKELLKEVLE